MQAELHAYEQSTSLPIFVYPIEKTGTAPVWLGEKIFWFENDYNNAKAPKFHVVYDNLRVVSQCSLREVKQQYLPLCCYLSP